MNTREQELGKYLSKIADELNITKTMQDKAIESYQAVGRWIGDGLEYDVKIMPQGSMNLGTVIKPIDDSDDYDMDLVCLLKNGQNLSLEQIKNLVGDRLKDNRMYSSKLEYPEGKRCWTMQYEEFHMDILPCVPKSGRFAEPSNTAIKLTHKNEQGIYEERFSNPYAYHLWFEKRMKDVLNEEKRMFAAQNRTEIEKVPTYRMRTPLQKAIQLLKRHRDITFQNNDEDAPISIIITTLAAHAYAGERNVYEALNNILQRMPMFIEKRENEYWIPNPVMAEENFADKWNLVPKKRETFTFWLQKAREQLLSEPLQCFGMDSIAKRYKDVLGEAPVERAFKVIGEETRIARSQGTLYASGLTGGLTANAGVDAKKVKEHTFFGQ